MEKEAKNELQTSKDIKYSNAWNININMFIVDTICTECRGSKDTKMYELLGIPDRNIKTWRTTIKALIDIEDNADSKHIKSIIGFISGKIPFMTEKIWYGDILCYEHGRRELLKDYAIMKCAYNESKSFVDKNTGSIKNAKSVSSRLRNARNAYVRNRWRYERKFEAAEAEWNRQLSLKKQGKEYDSRAELNLEAAKKNLDDYNLKCELASDKYDEHLLSNSKFLDGFNWVNELEHETQKIKNEIVELIKKDYMRTTVTKRPESNYEKLLYYLKFEEHHVGYDVKKYIQTSIAYIDAEMLWNNIIELDREGKITEDTFDNFIKSMDDQISVAKAARAIWKLNREKKARANQEE